MKSEELNEFVDDVLSEEIKSIILNESLGTKKQVFHIMCNGEPIDTFNNHDDALRELEEYKKQHPDKKLLIDRGLYESHDDMIDKLDGMGEQIEQNESNMKQSPVKAKNLHEAIEYAKGQGYKKVKINETVYDVEECWQEMNEEECNECEDKEMKEDNDKSGGVYSHKVDKEGSDKEFDKKNHPGGVYSDKKDEKKEPKKGVDLGKSFDKFKKETNEEKKICDKCGKEICECTINESKKNKSVRITEAQLAAVISNIVKESSSVPGISVTKKAQNGSKKENDKNASDVAKKMKDYLNFDGNDNPEFPKAIGKGERAAVHNTEEEEKIIDDNRGKGPQDAVYDLEPKEKFKEREKDSLEGDSKTGNPQDVNKKPTIKPSNGPKVDKVMDGGNTIKTDTGKKVAKASDRKEDIKKEEPIYKKEAVPVKTVKESKISFSSVLGEQLQKMSRTYNSKKIK